MPRARTTTHATQTPPRAGSAAARGFTLVELVAVVLILGILAATAIPATGRVARIRLDGAATIVQRTLSAAQERALAEGWCEGVEFHPTTGSLQRLSADGAGGVRAAGGLTGDPLLAVWLEEQTPGVTISAWRNGDGSGQAGGIWFDHTGRPHALPVASSPIDSTTRFIQDASVTLRTSAGSEQTRVVDALTGAVR